MRNGYMIEHPCPQCGTPIHFEEMDRVFSCGACQEKFCIMPGDHPRYLVPAETGGEAADLIYFPYWRHKAMVFSCLENGIEGGVLDLDSQATPSRRFPTSIGARGQGLKLRFASMDVAGRFIAPAIAAQDMTETVIRHRSKDISNPVFYKTHIGQSLSLVYWPFRLTDRLVDAVTDIPVSAGDPAEPLPESMPFHDLDWRVHLMSAACPNCGGRLDGQRDALVLTCADCRCAWRAIGGEFKKVEVCHRRSDNPNVAYLPFWCFSATVSGLALSTHGDLIRAANLPRVVKSPEADRPFHFWTPAFHVGPHAFMRLSVNLTLSQPTLPILREAPPGRTLSANFSVKAAAESLKITLAGLIRPREEFFPLLKNITVTARRVVLVYIPFMDSRHEWTHPNLPVTIHKNLFRSSNETEV